MNHPFPTSLPLLQTACTHQQNPPNKRKILLSMFPILAPTHVCNRKLKSRFQRVIDCRVFMKLKWLNVPLRFNFLFYCARVIKRWLLQVVFEVYDSYGNMPTSMVLQFDLALKVSNFLQVGFTSHPESNFGVKFIMWGWLYFHYFRFLCGDENC